MLPWALLAVKTTFPSQIFNVWDVYFVDFTLLLSFPLSAVSMMTSDLQVKQSQLWYSTSRKVHICGSRVENLICRLSVHSSSKPHFALLFLNYSCIQLVCITCLWVLLNSADSSQGSPGCSNRQSQAGHADHQGFWFMKMLKRIEELPFGEGGLKPSPHGAKYLLFSSLVFTARVVALCSQACCPGQQGVCCSRGCCFPEQANW